MTRGILGVLLAVSVFCSALGLAYLQFESRECWTRWQKLVEERDELEVEWGRLQLELSAWATAARVETLARDRLGMIHPAPGNTVIVRHE
ncbi:MAG: cell division protein FtsL [Pseudomonadota bacterium]|nr:cell division protein FtsL [Pseudomonadota bacterium]